MPEAHAPFAVDHEGFRQAIDAEVHADAAVGIGLRGKGATQQQQ